jgi:hypothetical protein
VSDEPATPADRLAYLEEVVGALRPVILASHSEHGLQGLSGLIGQYRAALKEVEELRALSAESKGTPLDELSKRRTARGADTPRQTRSAR